MSVEKLKKFLQEQRLKKNISYDSVKVIDYQKEVSEVAMDYDPNPVELETYSYYRYNIIGRLFTRLEEMYLNRKT